MPKELTNDENWELGLEWAKTKYPGVAVMAAMHRPDDRRSATSMSTCWSRPASSAQAVSVRRPVTSIPASPARRVPDRHHIESEDLPGQWRAFQTEFFRRKGIPVSVDPSRAMGGVHWGKARFIPGNDKEADDRAVTEAARLRMLDPANVPLEATKNRATFTRQRLVAILKAHDILGDEAKRYPRSRLQRSEYPAAVRSGDRQAPEPLYHPGGP